MNTTPNCPLCKLNDPANRNYAYLKEYKYWNVRVTPNQHLLGAHVISLKRHTEKMSDLEPREFEELIDIQKELENALEKTFRPHNYNYLQLGNVVRHLHIHMLPRYSDIKEFVELKWEDKIYRETPGVAPVLKQTPDPEYVVVGIKKEILKHL